RPHRSRQFISFFGASGASAKSICDRAKTKSATREQSLQSNQPFHGNHESAATRDSDLRGIHPAISKQRKIASGSRTTRAREIDNALICQVSRTTHAIA